MKTNKKLNSFIQTQKNKKSQIFKENNTKEKRWTTKKAERTNSMQKSSDRQCKSQHLQNHTK